MLRDDQYQEAIDLCSGFYNEKGEYIRGAASYDELYPVPLSILYVAMVERKEITPLTDLPQEQKKRYWNQTTGERFKRIMHCQALYMKELIKGFDG